MFSFGDNNGLHYTWTLTLSPGTSDFYSPDAFKTLQNNARLNVSFCAREIYDKYMMTNGPYAL